MNRLVNWQKGEGDYYFGWAKIRKVTSPAFLIIPHPGKWGWNGCRLLYNDRANTRVAELRYLEYTGVQSCKIRAATIAELAKNGTVDLAWLNWCRRVDDIGDVWWHQPPLEEWLEEVRQWHPAFRE